VYRRLEADSIHATQITLAIGAEYANADRQTVGAEYAISDMLWRGHGDDKTRPVLLASLVSIR